MSASNIALASRFELLPLSDHVGLLYPSEDATLLSDLHPNEMPDQLVIIDGTWHQAKTLFRDIPRLQSLRQFGLRPSAPGNYRIRREPDQLALSTLEATQAALAVIEPQTTGLDCLTVAFDQMIGDQLTNKSSRWRQNKKRRRGSPNVPHALTGNLDQIVVAYGEQERRMPIDQDGQRHDSPWPMYWTAIRLDDGQIFDCAIDCDSIRDADFLSRPKLSRNLIDNAVSIEQFRCRWRSFLKPGDQIATRHQSTVNLMKNADADFAPWIILKSICVPSDESRPEHHPPRLSLDDHPQPDSRAAHRLRESVAMVEYLNAAYGQTSRQK